MKVFPISFPDQQVGYNKIFFHMSSQGNRTGWGDLVRACDAAGIPVSVATVGGEGIGDIVALWDNGSVVPHVPMWRPSAHDVPPYGAPIVESAAHWWNWMKGQFSSEILRYHDRIAIKHGNELDKNQADWLGEFFQEVATLAMADPDGPFITAPFGWSTGEPERAHWLTPGMQGYLRMTDEYPDYCWVCIHEYSLNHNDIRDRYPFLIGRFQMLFEVCDELGLARPNIIIHEWGWELGTIPSTEQAMIDIDDIAELYAYYPQIKGAGIWTTQPYNHTGIQNEVAKLIPLVQQLTINTRYPVGPTSPPPVEPPVEPPIEPPVEPPVEPPPEGKHKVVVNKLAQEHTKPQWEIIGGYSHDDSKRTQTASHDDAETMILEGNEESFIRVIDPGLPSQESAIDYFERKGYEYQVQYIFTDPVEDPELDFKYTHWPTINMRVTQPFGANPDYYGRFGLPGHEGIDIASPYGTAYYAPRSGVITRVSDRRSNGSPSLYGWHIIIDHGDGYTTLMAHMEQNPPVTVGQTVIGGQLVGYSGNTGNSTGPHCHMTLKIDGYVHPGWECCPGYVDPAPYLVHLSDPGGPVVPPGEGPIIDLLGYLQPSSERPRLYEVETRINGVGHGQQRHQSHRDNMGSVFYHTKGGDGPSNPSEWEQLRIYQDRIQRYTDTSMGGGNYYTLTKQTDGTPYVDWLKRYMRAGEVFTSKPQVRVFKLENCERVTGPTPTTDYLKFVGVHATLECYNGIILHDVIEIQWAKTPAFERVEETYYYSKDPRAEGLVGWGNGRDGRWAFVSELHEPGQRLDNVRKHGCYS